MSAAKTVLYKNVSNSLTPKQMKIYFNIILKPKTFWKFSQIVVKEYRL